jgi:clan AA aspartic protease (TIGR02281 family)
VTNKGVQIPLLVNDRAATWLLDTGANLTVLSEAEAKTLGVVVDAATSRLDDLAGGTTTVRTARLQRLVIGGTELRNVRAVVLPDSQPPFNDLPQGRRGLIGLPVAVALGTVGWTKAGMCQTGPVGPRRTDNPPNLAFNDFQPLTRVAFSGGPLDFVLDTGNQAGTQLWARFERDFPALVKERGIKSTQRVNQIGGSTEREVTVISELPLRVGGRDTVLKPAIIFYRPVGDERRHGNLGMDVLGQATRVTIDFGSMALTLAQ